MKQLSWRGSQIKTVASEKWGITYYEIQHASGVTLMLCPMEGYSTSYALFSTNYGSVDTAFVEEEGNLVTIPDGTAHFLEHKLFESEEGDAFSRFAKTGASANAYTSFDKTSYLFGCSDHFRESFAILLDFVTSPYFTAETVAKEQGIIGQEIKMYEDDPGWRGFFNLLCALYRNSPLHLDIAGTVESIAQITPEMLYSCYHAFYNLNNMVISVAGNFQPEDVLELADRYLKKAPKREIVRKKVEEPAEIVRSYTEQILPVSMPIFQMGYKLKGGTPRENLHTQLLDEILLGILVGESSPLYRRLYDQGLINATFDAEVLTCREDMAALFSGESPDPQKVREELDKEVIRLQREGISPEIFDRYKKGTYGHYLSVLNNVENVASTMLLCRFYETEWLSLPEQVGAVTLEQVQNRLQEYSPERCALSVIKPE